MKRVLAPLTALLLAVLTVLALPIPAGAAALPAPYAAAAGGDVVALNLNVLRGVNLANARLAVTESTVNSTATPRSSATAANLGAAVAGLGVALDQNRQTAPPDNNGPQTGQVAAVNAPGLLTFGAGTTTVEAHYTTDAACVPGNLLADSQLRTTGGTVAPTGVGNILTTGDSSTRGTTELVPTTALNRSVRSTATGTINGVSLLGGTVRIGVAGISRLVATATGNPGGATVTYDPGTVTVTVGGTTTTLRPGDRRTFTVGLNSVTVTANRPIITEAANGQTATGAVSVVTAAVRVGPAATAAATATINLRPLRAAAAAPAGGIDCPGRPAAPVLREPADGSVTTDTTPTFTGTASPGATVAISVDGTRIGTTKAGPDGTFSFTPTTPLRYGDRIASATQTTPGGTSSRSNQNAFRIVPATPSATPVIVAPADGSTTSDRTPVVRGTGQPGATVAVSIDGRRIGTAVVDRDGNFSVPVTDPLDPGAHTVTAVQTDRAGTVSAAHPVRFTVTGSQDTAPQPPVITSPADGSSTGDPTPPIAGAAPAGSTVTIVLDGRQAGRVRAGQDGQFSFVPPTALAPGRHTVTATATDSAGRVSDRASDVGFRVTPRGSGGGGGFGGRTGSPGGTDLLANTGGPAWWVGVLGALFAVGGGTLTLARRRVRRARLP